MKSGAYEKTNSMLDVNRRKNEKFESNYVQGGPLFERFRNASEMAKYKKEINLKSDMREIYHD